MSKSHSKPIVWEVDKVGKYVAYVETQNKELQNKIHNLKTIGRQYRENSRAAERENASLSNTIGQLQIKIRNLKSIWRQYRDHFRASEIENIALVEANNQLHETTRNIKMIGRYYRERRRTSNKRDPSIPDETDEDCLGIESACQVSQ